MLHTAEKDRCYISKLDIQKSMRSHGLFLRFLKETANIIVSLLSISVGRSW